MSFLLRISRTSGGRTHEHDYAVDPHGDGNTTADNPEDPHVHIILGGKVMPAGEDDHEHDDVPFDFKNAPQRL